MRSFSPRDAEWAPFHAEGGETQAEYLVGAQPVELHLSKFCCEMTCGDVGAALERLGFSTALMSSIEPIAGVAEVPVECVRGAKIVVDEGGIEAGAYTAMVVCAGASDFDIEPRAPRAIALNRPFAFALVSRTGEPLFVAVVAEA